MVQDQNAKIIHFKPEDQSLFWNDIVTQLSLAETLPDISRIITHAGHFLARTDGTTFVLKDQDKCYYYDEVAVSPLWKGKRFPMSACISGWAMQNKRPAIIADIYKDQRIPHDAYRPTFVKSLCMVPVRALDPIAAIGSYWKDEHTPTDDEVNSLQILANLAAVSLEKVLLRGEFEKEITRSSGLSLKNRELEMYLYTIVHDLRNPIMTLSILLSDIRRHIPQMNTRVDANLNLGEETIERMAVQIDKMLSLYRMNCKALIRTPIDLGDLFCKTVNRLVMQYPDPVTQFEADSKVMVEGDPSLMAIVMENLLSNSFKFSKLHQPRKLQFHGVKKSSSEVICSIQDNGIGFEAEKAKDLFQPLVRLHKDSDYPGTGLGLASVAKIIEAHGGRTWAESQPAKGSIFYFSLPLINV